MAAATTPDADDVYIRSVFDKYRGSKPKLGPEELRELCYDLGFYFSDEEVASTVGIIIAFRIDKEDKSRTSLPELFLPSYNTCGSATRVVYNASEVEVPSLLTYKQPRLVSRSSSSSGRRTHTSSSE